MAAVREGGRGQKTDCHRRRCLRRQWRPSAATDGDAVALAGGRGGRDAQGTGNIENIFIAFVLKKLPADERSDHERFDAESDDAIANDHGAHIAPDCPADHGPTHH
jgi:hypothetical protein